MTPSLIIDYLVWHLVWCHNFFKINQSVTRVTDGEPRAYRKLWYIGMGYPRYPPSKKMANIKTIIQCMTKSNLVVLVDTRMLK